MKSTTLAKLSTLIYFVSCSLSVHAAEKYWIGSNCLSNNWNAQCWSATQGGVSDGTGQPQAGDNVYLFGAGDVYYSNNAALAPQLNSLNIDYPTSGSYGAFYQAGNLASQNETVGLTGYGQHIQQSGANAVSGTLTLGKQSNAVYDTTYNYYRSTSSTYSLNGGTLSASNEVIGDAGSGYFSQQGGNNTVSDTLTVGKQSTAIYNPVYNYYYNIDSGSYYLSTGVLTAHNEIIGDAGSGSFNQSGGTNTVSDTLTVGKQSNAGNSYFVYSNYGLNAGQLNANNEIIGDAGNGSFYQSGGTNTVSGTLTLGKQLTTAVNAYYSTSYGNYNLSAGQLNASDEIVGDAGNGSFYQSGGTNTVSGTLTLGKQLSAANTYYTASYGNYNLSAGQLNANNEVIGDAGSGNFSQSGGVNAVADTLTVGKQSTTVYDPLYNYYYAFGSSSYSLSGGALTAHNEIIGDAGSGYFYQSGGANTVSDTLTVGKQASPGYNNIYYYYGGSGYTLSSGLLAASNEVIGDAGNGTFTQGQDNFGYSSSGAINNVSNTLTVAKQAGSQGLYNLVAGALTALNEVIGDAGNGSFNQSGGTNTVNNTLTVGKQAGGQGAYNLSAGALIASSEVIGDAGSGTFTQGAGNFGYSATNTVNGTLTLGQQAGGHGVYNLIAGTLTTSNTVIGDAGTGEFNQSGGTNNVGQLLTLGKQAGSSGTYNLAAGALTAVNEVIGDAGSGKFTQGEGNFGYSATNTVGDTLTVGKQAGSNGIYNLIAGTLSALREVIGDAGTGTFDQSGGTHTVGETLTLGKQAGSQGTYNLRSGALAAVDEVIGDAGDGTFTQGQGKFGYSATNAVSGTLTLGAQAGSHGIYNLIAGALTTENTVVGDAGAGTFNQSGGTHAVNATLSVGKQAGSTGVYNLSSGALTATTEIIGDAGLGTFNQLDGSNTVADTLVIGKQLEGNGIYNLTAGQLNSAKTVVGDAGTGIFTQTGGTHTAQSLTLGKQASGYGNYNLLGGALNVGDEVIGDAGTGIFMQNGGTHKVDTLTLGKQSGGSGIYNLRGGNLQVGNIVHGAGTGSLLISGGSLSFGAGAHDVDVDTLKLSGQGAINLTDGATTTFEKDVVHNGKAIDLAAGTNAVFNGGFSGKGPFTGAGTATFNSVLNVGDGPITFSIAGNAVLGEHSKSIMEVAGLQRGTGYDALNIGGALTVGGELDLVSLNGFQAHLGDTFDLFSAETITGHFDLLSLMVLGDGLSWKIDYLIDAVGTTDIVRLSVVSSVPLPASIWLMQFALAGLVTAARQKRKAA